MTSDRPIALHLGDVAGAATTLAAALESHTAWRVERCQLPELAAGASPIVKHLALGPRAVTARLHVARAVRQIQPEVVHLHWARYAPFLDVDDRPLVVHAHGSDVRYRRSTLTGRLVDRGLRRAALVIASTPDLLDDLPPTARYLPNPVDTDLFCGAPPDSPAGPPTVLLFCRLVDVKGAPTILDAVRRLRLARPDAVVHGFAGGPYEAQARALGVELLPRLNRAQISERLRATTVVIGQQRLGALGQSELEAMSCQRPVITRIDAGRYDEPVPVVSVDDGAAIAERCAELLEDRATSARIGAEARAFVERHHAAALVADRLSTMYDELVER